MRKDSDVFIRVEELNTLLLEDKNIVLTSHFNPDGDAVGSLLAMYLYFKKKGFNVKAVLPNEMPDFYKWMPSVKDILIYEKNKAVVEDVINSCDVLFTIDYNSLKRVETMTALLENHKCIKVLIDHHLEHDDIYDFIFWDVSVSSSAELVYNYIAADGGISLIDRSMAECIYVGIMTDTGSFSFSCDKPDTYLVTAHLISKGIDVKKLHDLVYNNYSENRLRLLGLALSKRLEIVKGYKVSYIYLKLKDQEKFDFKPGDTEGLVNYTLAMGDVLFGVLFTQKRDKIRISFRSKGDFNVNEFARKHFNGGGHKNAAGAISRDSLEETVDYFLSLLPLYDQLKK